MGWAPLFNTSRKQALTAGSARVVARMITTSPSLTPREYSTSSLARPSILTSCILSPPLWTSSQPLQTTTARAIQSNRFVALSLLGSGR